MSAPLMKVVNHSGLPDTVVVQSQEIRSLAAELETWVRKAQDTKRAGSLWNRGTYAPPENPYDEMRAARHAVKYDDIVAGVAEVTEAFAFQGLKWESDEADAADVLNQIAGDLNLDAFVRKMWREDYTYSVAYGAAVWGYRTYTVRGRSPGEEPPLEKIVDPATGQVSYDEARDPDTNRPIKRPKGKRRKKKFTVYCPVQLRVLDATKIVPLGVGPLGVEMYAWQATPGEVGLFEEVRSGHKVDVGMDSFFLRRYLPEGEEKTALVKLGVDVDHLLLINPDMVFCHSSTKADYERFPDVRLKSCFGLLDLKRQLMAADRAMLVGAANYILLVKKGSKEEPATQAEIDNLRDKYQFVAKLPVIISDHRLEIEIISPKTDLTLDAEKYDVLDTRLLSRLLGTLSLGGRGQRNETNVTLSYAVARNMENRRHMLRRTLERQIAKAIYEHPRNEGLFESEPNLVYTPRNISLGFDQSYLQALMALRTQKEISRETILEVFGLSQDTEAMRREIEDERYDHIFQTAVPFSSPAMAGPNGGPTAPAVNGAQGGRPVGGGTPKANPTKATPKTPRGNTSTRKGSS